MKPQNKDNNLIAGHAFSPTILREYDIRGQIDKNLSETDAYALGRAFGTWLMGAADLHTHGTVCVGYDGRHSSPMLVNALIKGLSECGHHVDNIGLGPTPMLYFAVKDRGADAGIMVTGSHNPSDYNGFKMTLKDGPVFGEKIQEIGRVAASGAFNDGGGEVHNIDIKESFINRLLKDFKGERPMKVAWDAGNGAAGETLRMLTHHLPGEHFLLYDKIDGDFPNHHPDPTVDKNLMDLQKVVLENGCDLGIAFDGDGDRIGVVDENGTVLRCDILMTIYAKHVLENNPEAYIIGDVKCSSVMFDEIAKLGGKPVMWKTGHSLIKDKMAELNAPLAGELSGHIFFADQYYGYDDALYCAVRLLNALDEAEGALSTLTKDVPKLLNTPELRIEVDEERKFEIVPQIIDALNGALPDNYEMNTIDGIRITSPDGWWLLRPSNTQNVLVFRAESTTAEGLQKLKDMARAEVEKLGYALPFDEP